ncbi:hypothetical protein ACN42_g9052 [Penicillium freii]|uniref:Uncharacterized protein n=1 Tax=Penicillium freii TaxID=48697 RepID=A0A117NLR3_PENFR|nr:hypothetical protein ACN42_g9052 [Penicillium freii]
MNLVPVIIQQPYFDGCVRDSQLWALEARMQVLLDEMTHLQEEDGIDQHEDVLIATYICPCMYRILGHGREFPDRGAAAFMRALRLLLTEYLTARVITVST